MRASKDASQLLELFGIDHAGGLVSHSPIDGTVIGRVTVGDPETACARATEAFESWRSVPAPRSQSRMRCQPDHGFSSSFRVSTANVAEATCMRPSSIAGFGRHESSPPKRVNGLLASLVSQRSSLKPPVRLTMCPAKSEADTLPPCRWK